MNIIVLGAVGSLLGVAMTMFLSSFIKCGKGKVPCDRIEASVMVLLAAGIAAGAHLLSRREMRKGAAAATLF